MSLAVPVGWGDDLRDVDKRTPAFVLFVLLVMFSTLSLLVIFGGAFLDYPVAALFAALVWACYAVPFLLFIRRADLYEPEPRVLVAIAFVWGGIVAAGVAITANGALLSLVAKVGGVEAASRWGAAIAGPTTEETLKTLGVVMLVLIARNEINSTLDGLVYGAVVGLGFQVVENWVYSMNAVVATGGGDQIGPVLFMLFLRGFVAGLWSHAAYSAIAGAGVGYAVSRTDQPVAKRLGVAVALFLTAWSLHFVWNSPLVVENLPPGAILPALFVKGLPTVLLVLWLARSARRTEAVWFDTVVADEVPRGTITPGELGALSSMRARKKVWRAAKQKGGRQGKRLVRRLQGEQVALGMAKSKASVDLIEVDARRAQVHATHAELARLGIPSGTADAIAPSVRPGAAGWIALVLSALALPVPFLAPVALLVALLVRRSIRQRGLVPAVVRVAVVLAWVATALLGLLMLSSM